MQRTTGQLLCSISCLFLSLWDSGVFGQGSSDPEADLISYLKNNITKFSPLMRPCLNSSQVVYIGMDITVSQLVSVDSAKQSVKISALTLASWDEERLVWDPARFGNTTTVDWSTDNIWFPVILLYNGIGNNQVLTKQIPVFITSITPSTTSVTASWRNDFEFSCQFDMRKFPLDKHICELLFFINDQGHGNRLVQPKRKVPSFNVLGVYQPNSEWIMLNASATAGPRLFKLFENLPPVPLPIFSLRIEIQRVSIYYFINIITPLLLLTLLQVLVYFVPLESGEKLGFGITIMLSYTVFLLLLDGIVPKSQETPAIASFITAAMIISTISLLLTSIIMRFHFAPDGSRMPVCIRIVFVRFLGRLFCVSGASAPQAVGQAPRNDDRVTSMQKTSESEENSSDRSIDPRSDWMVAAHALERFMVALGVGATAIIISVFVVKPYI